MANTYYKFDYENAGAPADLIIPEGVTEISDSAFYGCTSLQSVTIPEGVTEIGDRAFLGCSSLRTVTLLNPKIKIERSAFTGCTGITIVNLPKGITWHNVKNKFKDSPWGQNKPKESK